MRKLFLLFTVFIAVDILKIKLFWAYAVVSISDPTTF
jgi:hypothetical protein